MKVKKENEKVDEKVGLKVHIQKAKTVASSPIISWQTDGNIMETVRDFIFLGSKITADGDYSHEIKRCLLLGKIAMTNLDSILKSRDITLPAKVHLVKAMVFPVVMYGCEIWNIKKDVCQKIDAFELCCWRRLLRVPWTSRRLNQSLLKEISPEYSLEGLMLKLHYFRQLMISTDSLERCWFWESLKKGGDANDREWDGWMASLTRWTWVWTSSRSWWWTGKPDVRRSMGSQKVRHSCCIWTDSLEGVMLKLKLQYFGHLMRKPTHWKDPDAGNDWRPGREGWQRMRWLEASQAQWTWVSANSRRWWRTWKPGVLQSVG